MNKINKENRNISFILFFFFFFFFFWFPNSFNLRSSSKEMFFFMEGKLFSGIHLF